MEVYAHILIKLKFLSLINNKKKMAFIVLMGRLKRDSGNNVFGIFINLVDER